jgi:hypothetical protein
LASIIGRPHYKPDWPCVRAARERRASWLGPSSEHRERGMPPLRLRPIVHIVRDAANRNFFLIEGVAATMACFRRANELDNAARIAD